MEIRKDVHLIKVEKKGFVDSSSIVAIRDAKGLTCIEIGGGGEQNIRQTLFLFEQEGLNVLDIHTVIISHTHADHMGAIAQFRDMIPGTRVLDHVVDAPYLRDNTLLNRIFDVQLVPKYFPGKSFDVLDFYRAFCPISETEPDQTVEEGDTLEFGEAVFEVIHTPGHHPGHISLYERNQGLLYVGDMVGLEVPFYTPSSGGVEGYLKSLKKYKAVNPGLIIPSHGGLIENPLEVIEAFERKVNQREERLLEALDQGPKAFLDLLPHLFRRESQYAFPGAAILTSHLDKLKNEGVAREVDGRYALSGTQ